MQEHKLSLTSELASWWRRQRQESSGFEAFRQLIAIFAEFARDSFPDRRRQRYGDADYDWEHRVDTTGATVDWRTRLSGLLNSPYQPIPPDEFHEIMGALALDFREFTFIDIGSGKGRALLLATGYGFRKITGVELLPELHRVARGNIQKCDFIAGKINVELICMDASNFLFPPDPTVVFLFNPLPQSALSFLLKNIRESLERNPRDLYLAYANPVLESVIESSPKLLKISEASRFSLFRSEHTNRKHQAAEGSE